VLAVQRHQHISFQEVTMRLSTRNQFPGKVVSITTGEAMSIVKVAIDGTDLVVTAAVTKDAVDDLGLVVGSSTYALVKATEVQLAVD
jgi:molybdate transport system regulatory protein